MIRGNRKDGSVAGIGGLIRVGVPAGDVSWMRLELDNRKAKRRENWERRVAANRP